MSTSTRTKIGHALAKVLRIDLNYRNPHPALNKVSRGESIFSVESADSFVEEEPTVVEWLREVTPTTHTITNYAHSLFPFTHWIGRYNVQWLIGDLVAGLCFIPCMFQTILIGIEKALPSVPWLSLRVWLMRYSLSWHRNLASIHRLWAF